MWYYMAEFQQYSASEFAIKPAPVRGKQFLKWNTLAICVLGLLYCAYIPYFVPLTKAFILCRKLWRNKQLYNPSLINMYSSCADARPILC